MLCDSHIHFIPQEISVYTAFYKGVWADKDKLYSFLDQNNIDKALLVYPSTDAHLKLESLSKVAEIYNSHLEKIIKENPKIIGAAILDVESIRNWPREIEGLKKRGFKALSIPSSENGKFLVNEMRPMFETIQNYDMPIFVHPQTINPIGFERVKDPLLMPVLEYSFDISMFLGLLMMEGILQKYNVKFIFSSLSGIVPFLSSRFDRVYEMLRKREIVKDLGQNPTQIFKNVYVDTSGASLNNIKMAMELFGSDKLLWGSDYPVCGNVENNLRIIDNLDYEIQQKLKFKNFNNLFSR